MFIYEFMSGTFDLITGGEEEPEYDPHVHRKIPKPTTYSETMIHMIKASVGAGVLAIPSAMQRVGLVFGMLGIVLIGAFATYCIQLLVVAQYKLCKRWRRGYMAYDKSMRLAVQAGPPCMRWMASWLAIGVNVMLLMWQLGLCGVYFLFAAENYKQVLDFYGYAIPLRLVIFYLFLPQVFISLVKDLKMLTPISMLSNFMIFIGLLLVFFYLVETDLEIHDDLFKMKSWEGIPLFVGITLFALEAVGVVLALEYNMENPKHFTGLCGLYSLGMCIIISLFATVGLFGYLKYGDLAEASITLNLPATDKKAQASRLLLATALFLSFPLQNFVAYQIIIRKTSKRIRNNVVYDYFMRVFIVVVPFVLAVTVPALGAAIALVGAMCLSTVGILFPAVIDMCVAYPDYGFANYKLFRDIFIMIAGAFCFFSGVYTSVLEFIHTVD